MAHIFISYSHLDDKGNKEGKDNKEDIGTASALYDKLKANDFDVWMDKKGIKPGEDWEKRILDKIKTCSAFVILLSPQSELSPWVMRELTYAIELEKLIFPLLLEGGKPWPLVKKRQCAKSPDELIERLTQLTRLFICHVPEDGAFAARLLRNLSELGANISQPSDQEDWESSQIMLLVVSPESMDLEKSPQIRAQWEAFDTAGKPIIPILLGHTHVAARLREKQPYVDFLNQDYPIAFSQLFGVLNSYGVNLKDHEKVTIPPQPQLQLDGYDMIEEARRAIWISGITLDNFARRILTGVFERNLQVNSIRLLMIDLDVQLANETGAWTGINLKRLATLSPNPEFEAWAAQQEQQKHTLTPEGRWIARRVFENQQILDGLRRQAPDKIKIRALRHRPATGYFIIDPDLKTGMLTASPYFYMVDHIRASQSARYNTSPIFLSKQSSKENDLWWFEQYVEEFERLWEDAKPWELD